MDNRRVAALFFGLGFLVIVAGIFMTSQGNLGNTGNNGGGGAGIQPQMINRGETNGITPNAINENMNTAPNTNMFNNDLSQKVIRELDNVDGVDNVDAVVSNNCALISCRVSENLRNQENFKETLVNKVKSIEPSLTTVYIMESNDGMNNDFSKMLSNIRNGDMNSAKQNWDNMIQQISSGNL